MFSTERIALVFAGLVILLLLVAIGVLLYLPKETPTPEENATEGCPGLYSPVCGIDNQTYNNSCYAQEAGVNVSYSGECQAEEAKCRDSDAGKDLFEAGNTTIGTTLKTDNCMDSDSLVEYYCQNDSIISESLGCPEGYQCDAGACSIAETKNMTCYDSDGISYFVTGAVSVDGENHIDQCVDEVTVREFYCDGSKAQSTDYPCPTDNICIDGKCMETPTSCTDGDGGKDVYTKTTVTMKKESKVIEEGTDACIDTDNVLEFYCSDNQIKDEAFPCGVGYKCQDGECVKAAACMDDDGGKDITIQGTVSKGSVSSTDTCKGSDVLEYYCDGDDIKSDQISCPSGQSCFNGVCAVAMKPAVCTDSDGQNINNEGIVFDGTASHTDFCPDTSKVVEFYCDSSNFVQNNTVTCPTGYSCHKGACEPPCVDTDGGIDLLIQGTISKGSASSDTDSCVNSSMVMEHFCGTDNEVFANAYPCPSGTTCSGGGCVFIAIVFCNDPDGTWDTSQKTTVTDSSGSYTDYCLPGGWVREYACQNTTHHTWNDIYCGTGSTCTNGVCSP